MKKLTKFEADVLNTILTSDSPKYLSHLETLVVTSREYTGCGQYVNFLDEKKNDDKMLVLGKKVHADINGLFHGAGFMLYVDDGKITCLEIYSYAEDSFPKNIKSYDIKILSD